MKKKIRLGVLGGHRGHSMIDYAHASQQDVELVAICDKMPEVLAHQRKVCGDGVAYYDSFDAFIKHDMDAVVLANYAHQHAPFAIRCMHEGKHVLSEVLPAHTLKEAVELVECVEETGMTYCYGENYCYMPGPARIRELYRADKLGELEYAEGEYVHNCEQLRPQITYGDPTHWRYNSYVTFYCTHSLGPIVHATGLRPVKVTGFESGMTERLARTGGRGGLFAVEMVEMNNGAIVKSTHGELYRDNVWYTFYGKKGRMETYRDSIEDLGVCRLVTELDAYDGGYETTVREDYYPKRPFDDVAEDFGHARSDFYLMYNFIRKLQGYKDADVIDVYEAMDMALPGIFAYKSVLAGGIPMALPDFRLKEDRDKWRNDTMCTDPETAGNMLVPPFSKGTPDIPMSVYEHMRELWLQYEKERKAKSEE